ncbi:MAG: class I SAM-dependent methyltransferase [Candidatus Bathyarchaeota archaeon]|nr:class I SAM-dependent methyltransferase [Candidatus Bathyarchaeota archaeon]
MEPKVATWTRPFLHELLEEIPKNVESLIDIGCGRGIVGAMTRIYRMPKRLVGIDIFQDYIDFCKKYTIYDELHRMDLRKTPLPFEDKEFCVATCIETIEHLPKKSGEKLLDELHRIAGTVIVSTPSSFFKQPDSHTSVNPFQEHVSKWTVEDFRKRGYDVKGVGSIALHKLAFPAHKLTCRFPHLHQFLLAKTKSR